MAIRLSRRERCVLGDILRHQCVEARLYRRARMVVLAAEGESISAIEWFIREWNDFEALSLVKTSSGAVGLVDS